MVLVSHSPDACAAGIQAPWYPPTRTGVSGPRSRSLASGVPIAEYIAAAILSGIAAYLSARFLLRYFRSGRLDPSLRGATTGAKAGFDLTTRDSAPIPQPPSYEGRRFDSVEAALRDGPKYFVELMAARASRDGREIVRDLDALRTRLSRDAEGRYVLK